MATMTITEALQSIKIATDKIAKKRSEIQQRVTHDSRMVDPLAQKGGSKEYIKAELQSIADLENNIVATRLAIQSANATNTLTVNGVERSVAAWLIWRREIAPAQQNGLAQLSNQIRTARAQALSANRTALTNMQQAAADVVVNLDERKLAEDSEALGEILGVLDGRLSAFNATHTIEV